MYPLAHTVLPACNLSHKLRLNLHSTRLVPGMAKHTDEVDAFGESCRLQRSISSRGRVAFQTRHGFHLFLQILHLLHLLQANVYEARRYTMHPACNRPREFLRELEKKGKAHSHSLG